MQLLLPVAGSPERADQNPFGQILLHDGAHLAVHLFLGAAQFPDLPEIDFR